MKIKIDLTVLNYNGGPQVQIIHNNKLYFEGKLSSKGYKHIDIDTQDIFPTKLIIRHHGKNMKYDTKLENGNILDDKAFIINKIKLNEYSLQHALHTFPLINNGKEEDKTNYIGYNGDYIIDIDSKDLSSWYWKLQKSFVHKLEEFDYYAFKDEIFGTKNYEIEY